MAIAVGLAVLAMYVTATFHPPTGINPMLMMVSDSLPSTFLPVLAGAGPLTAFACLWHRGMRSQPCPLRWF